MVKLGRAALLVATCALAAQCEGFSAPEAGSPSCNPKLVSATTRPKAMMRFAAVGDDFFAAPFPALGRSLGLAAFPAATPLLYHLRALVEDDADYAATAGVFFELTGGVTTPDVLPRRFVPPVVGASVTLFPLSAPKSPLPVNVTVARAKYADPALATKEGVLLSVLPVQGAPLEWDRDYVALVTTDVADAADEMAALCAGPIAGLDPSVYGKYTRAFADAASIGIGCDHIAALSVFHTVADPIVKLRAVHDLATSDFHAVHTSAITLHREADPASPGWRCRAAPYCVYSGTVTMPVYQRGTPPYLPYLDWHGEWPPGDVPALDPDPLRRRDGDWKPTWRAARVLVTIPKAAAGASGKYPTVNLVRTGAGTKGGDPLVDRGPTVGASCQYASCRGPSEVLQFAGFAGITVDGPLVGASRTEPIEMDEDLAIFDFLNPAALRDNIRQSAVELALVPDVADLVEVNLDECPEAGSGTVRPLDTSRLAIFSHSMGATVSPLALAIDARYGAAIMSGSGGSLIENVLYKTKPVPINAGGSLLGYSCVPEEHDPQLSFLQATLEASDSQAYARRMVSDPTAGIARSVLMVQGLVDHYIKPPIADTMTLAEGLDLAVGPASCDGNERCDALPVAGEVATPDYPPLVDLLPLAGRRVLSLPLSANVVTAGASLTAAVVQHRIDENREPAGQACDVDAHEVIYESTLARHQYACFLDDFARGKTPTIRATGSDLSPCN